MGLPSTVAFLFGIIAVAGVIWNPDLGLFWRRFLARRQRLPETETKGCLSPAGFGAKETPSGLGQAHQSSLTRNLSRIRDALEARKHAFKEDVFIPIVPEKAADVNYLSAKAYSLCEHCSLRGISLGVTFEPLSNGAHDPISKHGTDAAGHVLRFDANRFSVWINPQFVDFPETIGAILAHEIAHIFSFTTGLAFRSKASGHEDTLASEQMTDLLAIVLGMGPMLVQGCAFSNFPGAQDVRGFDRGTVGYLTPAMMSFAHQTWQRMRPHP